jgi:DNA-binding MarR family transcriptional regulator
MRLARVFQRMNQATAEELRRFGLSVSQFDVLVNVGRSPGTTQQELANSLLVTKSNVCQLLDRMERSGLVERRQDGRAKRVYLTQAGNALYEQAVPGHEEQVIARMSALASLEQRELRALLRRLDRALK